MRKLVVVAAWLASHAMAHAVVLSDTQVILESGASHGADYELLVNQAPEREDLTAVFFNKQNAAGSSRLGVVTSTVDQGVDLFLVRAGDVISSAALAEGRYPVLKELGALAFVDVPLPGDFYLGLATTDYVYASEYQTRNVWGWAHFRNDAAGLRLLGSAVAYGEGGIVVGTITPVPEPSTLLLACLGLTGIACVSPKTPRLAA
ncbi:hypothetical protein DEH84_17565 (plasmid) [Aquabacterium olei]|uniref:Ice-binding protein C-terminal domain-containing protein n=1 Tax=Aquabacterium olei TaxID=1296669 RepID=A0A2U8FWG2_9BURK|nr:PEP-CTERM sorting domain-containing protein [Aquabacterium olei]AWI55402.1 hypothetical protein DEH84_17565 [Aquabacterium olei]